LRQTRAKLTSEIQRLGGSVCKSVRSQDVTHILTDAVSVHQGDVCDVLKGSGVVGVDEGWLDSVAEKMIVGYQEGVVGGTPPYFDPKFGLKKPRVGRGHEVEAASKYRRISVREGVEVFSESGLDCTQHSVARESHKCSKPLTATLNMTDVLKNKNSYYKLQVVVSDSSLSSTKPKPQKFYFVRVWGRVGCDYIGGSQVPP